MGITKILLVILLVIIGSFIFYWFQIRPSQIMHACSWVKMHSDAITERPAMTREELESKGIVRTCKNDFELVSKLVPNYDISSNNKIPPLFDKNLSFEQKRIIWNAISCREDSDRVIAEYKTEIKAIPAKNWYDKASDKEYKFCLH